MAETGRIRPVLHQRIALAAAVIFIAVDLVAVVLRRMRYSGDFDISMEFGRRFLTGRHLYEGGLHFPYLPAAAMFFSLFSLMPKPLAFLVFYSMAIACLWLVMRLLGAMVYGAEPILRDRSWRVADGRDVTPPPPDVWVPRPRSRRRRAFSSPSCYGSDAGVWRLTRQSRPRFG